MDITKDLTIPKLFNQQAKRYGDKVAMREKDYGIWQSYSWDDYREYAMAVANGLLACGAVGISFALSVTVFLRLIRLPAAERFVSDPERREELVRWVLARLGLRPAGESEHQAADRLSALDSVLALSTPRLTQSFSTAEIVDCGIPLMSAKSF